MNLNGRTIDELAILPFQQTLAHLAGSRILSRHHVHVVLMEEAESAYSILVTGLAATAMLEARVLALVYMTNNET